MTSRDIEMRHAVRLSLLLLVSLNLLTDPATAGPIFDQIKEGACRNDYYAYCAHILPGQGRVLACLRENASKLTQACKNWGNFIEDDKGNKNNFEIMETRDQEDEVDMLTGQKKTNLVCSAFSWFSKEWCRPKDSGEGVVQDSYSDYSLVNQTQSSCSGSDWFSNPSCRTGSPDGTGESSQD